MDGQKPLEVTATAMTNEASSSSSSSSSSSGLRRQPTKYPHGLNITVQTVDDNGTDDDYSRASTLRSSSSSEACWSETQKYRIGMLGSPETLAELQVRRYKYPLKANYYLNGGGMGNPQGKPTATPLMLLGYAKRACRWKYMRWPIIFVASVLLFFGLITYCLWLHDVSVARARFLQRRYEASLTSTSTEGGDIGSGSGSSSGTWNDDGETMGIMTTTATIAYDHEQHESTRLQPIDIIHREHSTESSEVSEENEEEVEERPAEGDDDYDDALLPADSIRFTSGHQNSFGVPIEQDKRMLQLLKDLLPKPYSTPSGSVQPLTRVSPTLPPPSAVSGKPTVAMTTTPSTNSAGCYSTMLPMCRGVLDYDLTYNNASGTPRDSISMAAYEQLIQANCSARAVEFVCASLEPECRPSHIGQLPPCRRICKAILEACSIVIANSDALSELFDCSFYPDSHENHKCEDPTRRRDHCYANEFQCHDGSCIPQQWQCDNIKDCAGGEDEDEQCLVCEQQDEFRCRSNEKCIPENQRCDLNYDCTDGSDEEDCDDYGSGDSTPFDEAELNAFPRIFSYASFLSPNETNDKLYTYITATTDEEAGTETKFQVHRVEAPSQATNNSEETNGGPKGFVNFRDSKEIMMTSDSENKFKYSSQRANRTTSKFSLMPSTTPAARTASAIPSSALLQQRERERRVSTTTTTPKTTSTSVITTTTSTTTTTTTTTPNPTTRNPDSNSCLTHELRCVSGKCITVSQLCDKQVDCPDAADELMCVYRERPNGRRGSSTTRTSSPTSSSSSSSTTQPNSLSSTTVMNTTTRRSVRTTPNRSRKPKS